MIGESLFGIMLYFLGNRYSNDLGIAMEIKYLHELGSRCPESFRWKLY
jgi:hypothetical protein